MGGMNSHHYTKHALQNIIEKHVSSAAVQAVKENFIMYKPFLSFLDFHLEMKAWEDLTHFQALEPVMKKTPHWYKSVSILNERLFQFSAAEYESYEQQWVFSEMITDNLQHNLLYYSWG